MRPLSSRTTRTTSGVFLISPMIVFGILWNGNFSKTKPFGQKLANVTLLTFGAKYWNQSFELGGKLTKFRQDNQKKSL